MSGSSDKIRAESVVSDAFSLREESWDAARPLVSIITPTRDRQAFHQTIWNCVKSQDYPNIEWLVDDDSSQESPFLSGLCDERVTYRHSSAVRAVGEKRNSLIQQARGEFIVHFDDDDYYASSYVSHVIKQLMTAGADIAKLIGYFVYDKRTQRSFYWDQDDCTNMRILCKPNIPQSTTAPSNNSEMNYRHKMGYGFSYAYRKAVWQNHPFEHIDMAEDFRFMQEALTRFTSKLLVDDTGLCVHVIHQNNLSGCFPQYMIPHFLFDRVFPGARVAIDGIPHRQSAAPLLSNEGVR